MVTARAFSLLPVVVAVAACSSSSPAVPEAGVDVVVSPGVQNTSTQCPIVGEDAQWGIGDGNGEQLSPIADGQTANGASVSVQCEVHPQGGGFYVTGDVELNGHGSITISGNFDGTTNPQPNITATFVLSGGLGDWTDTSCTVTFTGYAGMGIAAGRVWGTIDCPSMVDAQHSTQCDGNAEFEFENCNQ